MPIGIVKWFNLQKVYGFIVSDDSGEDVFVHISAVEQAGSLGLNEGQKIKYDLAEGKNGKMTAHNISVDYE
jgi:cold shock protein